MTLPSVPEIAFGRPLIGDEERAAVRDVLDGFTLVHGPHALAFESAFAAFLGPNAFATTVSSCTAGLHLAYMHLGVGVGDEVIMPAQTHVATAHAVEITGARPVFIDSDSSGNMDLALVEEAITSRTKAICVVHYLGLPVDVSEVVRLARPRGIAVVEDCALAIGGSLEGVSCGLLGDIASFSFYPAKHITTGEGGMVVSTRQGTVESISNLKAFGYDRSPDGRTIPGVYDITRLGLNYRMSEVAAAIGTIQVGRVPGFLERRHENAGALRSMLSEVPHVTVLQAGDERRTHANYCLVVQLDEPFLRLRNDVVSRLKARGVGTSVYYPVPIPLSKYYLERYGANAADYPTASRISNGSIALPVGPHLGVADMDRIAYEFRSAVEEVLVS